MNGSARFGVGTACPLRGYQGHPPNPAPLGWVAGLSGREGVLNPSAIVETAKFSLGVGRWGGVVLNLPVQVCLGVDLLGNTLRLAPLSLVTHPLGVGRQGQPA